MKKRNGYTLVELVVAVSLLSIVLLGGTIIFFKSFKSSGVSDAQTNVNNSVRSLEEMIEKAVKYGTVYRVVGASDNDRTACLAAGSTGVVGSQVSVRDLNGGSALYSFANGEVSSNSAVISNPSVTVTKFQITWYCRSGVNDKMKIEIEATSGKVNQDLVVGKLEKDINLLNSGIN